MITVRVATEHDAEILARFMTELNEAVGADGLPPPLDRARDSVKVSREQMQRRLRASAAVETELIAEVDGAPMGFVAVRVVPYLGQEVPYAEVTQLYVTPWQRRLGVALTLMREAESFAIARGCTAVHVFVVTSNADARAVLHGCRVPTAIRRA